jgi:hypothetical protein
VELLDFDTAERDLLIALIHHAAGRAGPAVMAPRISFAFVLRLGVPEQGSALAHSRGGCIG